MLLRYYGMVLLVLYKDLIYIYIVQEDRSTVLRMICLLNQTKSWLMFGSFYRLIINGVVRSFCGRDNIFHVEDMNIDSTKQKLFQSCMTS